MNKFCSIFSQLLQLFPRTEFYRAVKETNAEYHARGFLAGSSLFLCCFVNWVEHIL